MSLDKKLLNAGAAAYLTQYRSRFSELGFFHPTIGVYLNGSNSYEVKLFLQTTSGNFSDQDNAIIKKHVPTLFNYEGHDIPITVVKKSYVD